MPLHLWFSFPFQPGTPQARPYEAPSPGSGWAGWGDASGKAQSTCATGWGDTSGNAQSTCAPSTPIVQPTAPVSAASYLPGTPGGQPMTPGDAGMDSMFPVIGSSLAFCTVTFAVKIILQSGALDWIKRAQRNKRSIFLKCLQVGRLRATGFCQMFW